MKVNIKMISEITGFSPATVSNALNNKKGVNRKTAEIIMKTAEEYGYSIAKKITSIKLVIYKDSNLFASDTPLFTNLLEGIESEAQKNGIEIIIFNLDKNSPDYTLRLNELLSDTCSAIIFLGTELTEADAVTMSNIPVPMVMLDAWFEKTMFDTVEINNLDSVYEAVNYLIENGHKKIGYLYSKTRIKNFQFRSYGYANAMRSANLRAERKYCFGLTPNIYKAFEDMEQIIKSRTELPTAFFADNDIIALGAVKALQTYGYKVPDDISVIGFDDMPFCQVSDPTLTTIRVHKKDIGRLAVKCLIEKLSQKQSIGIKISVNNEFVIRDSVKKIT